MSSVAQQFYVLKTFYAPQPFEKHASTRKRPLFLHPGFADRLQQKPAMFSDVLKHMLVMEKSRFRPPAERRAANTSTTCSFLTWSCVGVQLTLFTPFDFHFFVLSVIQGHYVMLMRASHLEKCHWDAGIAELTSGLRNSLPVEDISNSGWRREKFAAHQLNKTTYVKESFQQASCCFYWFRSRIWPWTWPTYCITFFHFFLTIDNFIFMHNF